MTKYEVQYIEDILITPYIVLCKQSFSREVGYLLVNIR